MLASSFSSADAAELAQASVAAAKAPNSSVRGQVEAYFSDIPELIAIASCESHMRHYSANGDTLRGEIDSGDVGVMQINERYHRETAEKLGLDIEKIEDNMVYARKLFEKQGTKPWNSSKKCWGPKIELAAN